MKTNSELIRKCPNPDNNLNCKRIIYYIHNSLLNKATRENTVCRSCAVYGKNNSMYGKNCSDETKQKISEATRGTNHHFYGKKRPEMTGKNHPNYGKSNYDRWLEKYGKKEADKRQKITNEKNSKNNSGKNNPMYGRCAYDIWVEKYGKEEADKRQKIINEKNSKSNRIRRIEEIKEKHGIFFPNHNKKSIPIIEAKAKELGITDLQHAENGGEFHIKELGYWVDGYSKDKNIVIEYYEPFHKKQKERDKRRKQEIIDELGCEFIIIHEVGV